LGKEFLLFQILKDDFISFVVRACWIISFFFTPIYMFILVFVVMFGPKKGSVSVYSSFWNFIFFSFSSAIISFLNRRTSRYNLEFHATLRFQFSAVTARPTIYVLFSFWCFFFFFGEILFLILFNFSNLNDTIASNFFFNFKTHTSFYLNNYSFFLSNNILFFIFFFTISAFFFLLTLRYEFNYNYFRFFFLIDIIFFFLMLFLFNYFFFIYLIILFFLRFIIKNF
jgi:hypothetical protein